MADQSKSVAGAQSKQGDEIAFAALVQELERLFFTEDARAITEKNNGIIIAAAEAGFDVERLGSVFTAPQMQPVLRRLEADKRGFLRKYGKRKQELIAKYGIWPIPD